MKNRTSKKLFYPLLVAMFIAIGATITDAQSSQDDTYNGDHVLHTFEKIQLSTTFYAEGVGIGDVNGNGTRDVVCGPYWYEGPEFSRRHAYYEPEEFDPLNYSDNFIVALDDVNGNGRNDILVVGFPGQSAFWYENPQAGMGLWQRHPIYHQVDNESAGFYDITGNGKQELLFHTDGYLGYAAPGPGPAEPWTFHRISRQEEWGHFHHGLGLGDITGNGHQDVLMADGWWENPGSDRDGETPWQYHPADFGPGGAQMYAMDVDGDGLNDVVTSLEAHGWGLAWYRQVRAGSEIDFEKHLIMGDTRENNPYGVRFSQPHAVALADLDGNGRKDVITGKRFWAHGPDGDPEPNAPAVIYWFKPDRDEAGQAEFIPYLVDDDSGVGTQMATGDLSGNGYPDITTCNKKGAFIFLNRPQNVSREEWEAAQPERIEK